MSKELIVGDYMFSTLEEANVAKLELDKINKLNEKLEGADDELFYKVYNKSIEKNSFRTPVGLEYMRFLKKKLEKSKTVKETVLPIPVNMNSYDNSSKEEINDNLKKYKNDAQRFSSFFKWSLFINAVLVIIIIALFVIASTSKNPNILNYENTLVDKYASWESELTQKEKELKERERQIEYRENNPDINVSE